MAEHFSPTERERPAAVRLPLGVDDDPAAGEIYIRDDGGTGRDVARVNVRALGVRRPSFGREWATLAFLVPVLNTFRPYQVVREIWQASDPEGRDAFNWRSLPVSRLLPAWWVLFVGWGALQLMALLSDTGTALSLAKLQLSRGLTTLADVCAAVSAFLACFVVARISDAQQEKWQKHQRAEAQSASF